MLMTILYTILALMGITLFVLMIVGAEMLIQTKA
jgi:hypothetical protein